MVGATFIVTVTGFSWAITQWAPFSLVGDDFLFASRKANHTISSRKRSSRNPPHRALTIPARSIWQIHAPPRGEATMANALCSFLATTATRRKRKTTPRHGAVKIGGVCSATRAHRSAVSTSVAAGATKTASRLSPPRDARRTR